MALRPGTHVRTCKAGVRLQGPHMHTVSVHSDWRRNCRTVHPSTEHSGCGTARHVHPNASVAYYEQASSRNS